jgi:hypothetical protein
MKKIILMMAGMLSITYGTMAQNQVAVGFKVGTNYSNVYDADGDDFEAEGKFGLAAGGFVSIPIGDFLGVQPEVLYSQKGFKATGTMLGGTYELTRTTSYIDVPLLIAIKPIEAITFLAGPQFSFLLKQNDKFTSGTTSFAQQEAFDNDNLRKNTLCFTGGIDINLEHTVVGLRTGWDLQNNNGNGTSSTPRYKNVWVQATIGYRFYN